jgi:hypothetical protein
MKKITQYATTVTMLVIITLSLAKTALHERLEAIDNDRGDVPGWAIASGAACLLAALVYHAYSGVITKWISKIN